MNGDEFGNRAPGELGRGLRALAESLEQTQAPPRLERRLLTAFRAQNGLPQSRKRPAWVPALAWAGAFAAMLIAGLIVMRERPVESKRATPSRAVAVMAVAETPLNTMEAAAEDGFVALPGAASLAPADDMDMVHVELPRSAMMQVGIEVSPERADETVQADVMVGSDGLARAVRFVELTGSD